MNIQPMYTPKVLKNFKAPVDEYNVICRYEYTYADRPKLDEDKNQVLDKNGDVIFVKTRIGKTMVRTSVESEGGIMFTFPQKGAGMPPHSIRLTTPEQISQFKLSNQPLLIDLDTGLECDAHGMPLALKSYISENVTNEDED